MATPATLESLPPTVLESIFEALSLADAARAACAFSGLRAAHAAVCSRVRVLDQRRLGAAWTPAAMRCLLHSCPAVEALSLAGCADDMLCATLAACACPVLRTLSVAGSPDVTDLGLGRMCSPAFSGLRIDATFCPRVTQRSARAASAANVQLRRLPAWFSRAWVCQRCGALHLL